MSWLFAIGGFLKRVPWQAWLAIALALAAWQGVEWHGNRVKRMLTAADTAGYTRAMSEVASAQAAATLAATQRKAKAEREQSTITQEVQSDHAQTVGTIRDRAAALRVRGRETQVDTHRAGGVDLPGLSGATGRADAATGGNGLPRPARPQGLDWDGQVAALEQCDLNTAQLLDLQRWLREQAAAFPTSDGGEAVP